MVFEGIHCRLVIERPATGVVLVRLSGSDVGEFGDAPLRELAKDIDDARPLQLYIDARAAKGASIDVSNEWAQWLRANRSRLNHVSMLTGSPFVQLSAKFVRRFADLEDAMRIYTDHAAFDGALSESVARNR